MSDGASPSPPEGAPPVNPPHFKVGLGFVKAYYKALTEQPDMLVNFYKAGTSYLGHGEGSAAADPKPLEEYDLSIKERWGCSDNQKMRFDFEYGAIDTQPVNGGVLLVVTAQVFFESPKNGEGEKSSATPKSKSFVQTFFLVREGRNFACYNDILRFVEFPDKASKGSPAPTATASTNTTSTITAEVGVATDDAAVVEKATSEAEQTVKEETQDKAAPPAVADEAPGGGVEETKEEAPDSEEEVPAKPAEKPVKDGRGKKNKGGSKNQQQQSANKPTPGSWASLVASGGSAPNTPSRKSAPAESEKGEALAAAPEEKVEANETTKEAATTAEDATATSSSTTTNNNSKPTPKPQPLQQRPKRDPDNTLVIKNLSDNIKEQDLIIMFKPFAVQTNAKIVGTNLNHSRGLAFVDYDQVAPVLAVLAKHQETPFQWNGKVLEVDQKTQEVRARRKAGGGYNRSGSPGNGFRNSGRGGGGDFRRGDRGGRRSGRGGRGGR
jgi:Nuclear transport factor 2 (NTF2) domain/RNA recognition motif. (a.k.a. RRM, RBD, or RNP domain)